MYRFAREGYPFIFGFLLITSIASVLWIYFTSYFLLLTSYFFLGLTIFMIFFFRDPERKIPEGEGIFVSPADGKVILIQKDINPSFPPLTPLYPPLLRGELKGGEGGFLEVSIFMSPLDVHVNRSPCDGVVESVVYTPGKFLSAFKPEAALQNENIAMVIDGKEGRVLVRQVAGFIARRAVCRVKVGDVLRRGERYGLIKFGSRLDVYLPKDTKIMVKLGDKVKAGETVIATTFL
jgi:phosphatidylserine decarboxylase